jgi:lipopolysaccharide transport system ATP-binding protein
VIEELVALSAVERQSSALLASTSEMTRRRSDADVAIRVEGLSKRYRISGGQRPLDANTDAPRRRFDWRAYLPWEGASERTFWALSDVSFEVGRGEIVGIIGRNGAGKSTLLKILSQITEPSAGLATITGRVGSLLEVGTGFHPELTGRENVYLNGAILGMSRAEINRKFDEIVAFADVERFLDTPVKRYSSGMQVRLAFAVAAHLEADILLVDEVLAVGDLAFQTKCLGKIGEVAKTGRTVLFVSHNMGPLSVLCDTGLWLSEGRVAASGPVDRVIAAYVSQLNAAEQPQGWLTAAHRTGTGAVRFTDVRLLNDDGLETSTFAMGGTLTIEMSAKAFERIPSLELALLIKTAYGVNVAHVTDRDDGFVVGSVTPETTTTVRVSLPELRLYPGNYLLSVWAGDFTHDFDYVIDGMTFTVVQSAFVMRTSELSQSKALVLLPCSWSRSDSLRRGGQVSGGLYPARP